MRTLRQYLDDNSIPEPNSGCRLWTGSVDRQGYGMACYQWSKPKAHRMSFMEKHGPVPYGICVCHKCDTPGCINVDHLFLGTPMENTEDMIRKGRKPRGSKCSFASLDESVVEEIKKDPSTQKQIAMRFGVSQTLVGKIKRGEAWTHVETLVINTPHLDRADGEDHVRAKLTNKSVKEIRQSTGVSIAHLARKYSVSRRTISRVLDRENWTHIA